MSRTKTHHSAVRNHKELKKKETTSFTPLALQIVQNLLFLRACNEGADTAVKYNLHAKITTLQSCQCGKSVFMGWQLKLTQMNRSAIREFHQMADKTGIYYLIVFIIVSIRLCLA